MFATTLTRLPRVWTIVVALAAVIAPARTLGQAPADGTPENRATAANARRIAERFERDARVLTIFDRQGRVVTTVGERGIYNNPPIFSPDRGRLAVIKRDLERETVDLWVVDVRTGTSRQLTASSPREYARFPVWSPDGRQVAYVALRNGREAVYRQPSSGEGAEEILHRHAGAGLTLTDWSVDGRFLAFSTTDLAGGTLYALPLGGSGERTPIEILKSPFQVQAPRLSPDSRFVLYRSDESGRMEVHVRPFNQSLATGSAPAPGSWQVSDHGGVGMALWRRDGKEVFYMAADRGMMAVEVSTARGFAHGQPKLLFRPAEWFTPMLSIVSPDGERLAFAVPHNPTLQQITVFDRQGRVVSQVGEPGRYAQPRLSPDGTRVAVVRRVPRTENEDIWTFDVASGKGTPVTDDASSEDSPVWSPDGRQLAYASWRGTTQSIFRRGSASSGREEHLFRYTPGAGLQVTDWSEDGRFLIFQDDCAGVLHALPLAADAAAGERKAVDWLRDEYSVGQARLSPDSRFMAYLSDELEADTFELYVRPFDGDHPEAGAGSATPTRVSTGGSVGMISWRQDGKELYYLTPDWDVIAVDISTSPTFQVGTPRRLFTLPGRPNRNAQQWSNVSRDGQRFVFTISVPVSISAR